MQNKTERPRRRLRRPLLFGGLLVGAGILSAWLFLVNFDLDRYRGQISTELSKQLQLPVQFGRAELVVREAGIACRLTDVAIGTPQADRELTARTIWLQLAWRSVLLRQLLFSEIALDEPHLRVAIGSAQPREPATDQTITANDWLDELRIHRIEVRRGTLNLSWHTATSATPRQLRLYAVNLDIDDLAKGETALFDLSSQLRDDPSRPERIILKGSLTLPAEGVPTGGAWDLTLEGKSITLAPLTGLLPENYGVAANGDADLILISRGSLAAGASFQARLSGDHLRLRPGNAWHQKVSFKNLQLTGGWQRTPEGHGFHDLDVKLDDLHLAGALTVGITSTTVAVHGNLDSGTLPLATVTRWLPEGVRQKTALLQSLRPVGDVQLSKLVFRAGGTRDDHAPPSFTLERLHGEARQVAWTLTGGQQLELVSLPVRLADGRWQITQGEVRLGSVPIQLTGAVTLPEGAPPAMILDLAAKGETKQFAALWPHPLPEQLVLGGDLAWQAHLEGTTEELAIALRADLSQLQAGYGEQVNLPPTAGANWVAQGTLTPTGLRLAHGDLSLPPFQGQFQGAIDWADVPVVDFTGSLALDELIDLHPQIPLLAELGLHGGIAIDLAAQGPLTEPLYHGSCELRDLGLPMHGVIGDISALRGTVRIDGWRLQGERISALLGRSPVELQVNVTDLATLRLDLKVRATAVRADELIFRSDSRMLRDLNGRLLIDGDGISFAPVHVRLDQGTRATIHGSVKNFTAPKVDLSISGEYANVAEIIALWADESPVAKTARLARHADQPHKPLPPIRITVDAKNGDLYGMQFSEARTLIVPGDKHLLLHPLDFKVGDGYCTTQVLLDYTGENLLLRVSGHAENLDAYQVYNELLERKSIMRGILRGDFYLQGELGHPGSKRFLSTSYGNVNFSVRDGVMRHSPLLGTIFSVLNVSQLFQGKLPDVSREGVPFNLMTAELGIDKGVLQTNELVMRSNALDMTYLGKYNMLDDQLDLLVVVKPLGTIDTVVSHLPVAGWILTGEERTLLTAQFKVTGPGSDPEIEAIPISTLSKGVLGIIQRTLSLPYKLVTDPAILWGGRGKKD